MDKLPFVYPFYGEWIFVDSGFCRYNANIFIHLSCCIGARTSQGYMPDERDMCVTCCSTHIWFAFSPALNWASLCCLPSSALSTASLQASVNQVCMK